MKELLGAVSALALLAGVAMAQEAGTGAAPAPTTPPAAAPAPTPEAMPTAPMPQAEAPAAPAASPSTPPAATETAAGGEPVSAEDMMGREVEGSDGQPLGTISDVIVDSATGKIQRVVIASGGVLGIGAKNVAVAFEEIEVRPEGGVVAKGVTQADVEAMPEFDVTTQTKPLDEPPPALPTTTAPGATTSPGAMGASGAIGPTPGATGAGGATAPAAGQ